MLHAICTRGRRPLCPDDGLRLNRARRRAIGDQRLIERLAAFVGECGLARRTNCRRSFVGVQCRIVGEMLEDVTEILLAALIRRAVTLDQAPAERDLERELRVLTY